MTSIVGEATILLKTDDSGVQKGAQAAGSSAGSKYGKGFSTSMKNLIGAAGIAVGAAAAVNLIKGSMAEAQEAQKVGAQTTATIKATGGAANVTAQQVGDLATALSAKVGMDDEAIQTGENLLLTFKNVRNEVGKGN